MPRSWTFYATRESDAAYAPEPPTLGGLLDGLGALGFVRTATVPVMDDGRPVGHEEAELDAPLFDASLYLTDPAGADRVTLSLTARAASEAVRRRYLADVGDGEAAPERLVGALAVAAYGFRGQGELPVVQALLAVLEGHFPGGVVVDDVARRPHSTRIIRSALVQPVRRIYRMAGQLGLDSSGREHLAKRLAGDPMLARLARLDERGLSVPPCTLKLTEEQWGKVYMAVREWASVATRGELRARCDGEFDTRIVARGPIEAQA